MYVFIELQYLIIIVTIKVIVFFKIDLLPISWGYSR